MRRQIGFGFALVVATLLISSSAMAQGQNGQAAKAPSFAGVVANASGDGSSFTIVDKNGGVVIPLSPQTNFLMSKNPARFADVIRFGMDVKGTYAPDGTAMQVTGQGFTTQLDPAQLQFFMGVSEAEWAVLKPRIDKVRALQRLVDGKNPNSGNGNTGQNGNAAPAARGANPVKDMQTQLQNTFYALAGSGPQLTNELDALRAARAKVRDDLAAARKDLTDIVTSRQEVLLVLMGILE